jgi:hypothetical protein
LQPKGKEDSRIRVHAVTLLSVDNTILSVVCYSFASATCWNIVVKRSSACGIGSYRVRGTHHDGREINPADRWACSLRGSARAANGSAALLPPAGDAAGASLCRPQGYADAGSSFTGGTGIDRVGPATVRACTSGVEVCVTAPDEATARVLRAALDQTSSRRGTDRLIRIVGD